MEQLLGLFCYAWSNRYSNTFVQSEPRTLWYYILVIYSFAQTRSYAALRAADLDWIVGPGYSLGRNIIYYILCFIQS